MEKQTKNSRKRRPVLAAFLSLITPGLGQLYNAQTGKALAFYMCTLLFYPIVSLTSIAFHFNGAVFLLLAILCFLAVVLCDAAFSARRLKQVKMRGYNKWYVYLAVFLVHVIAIAPIMESVLFPRPVKAYRIPSGAMKPTLQIGDHIIATLTPHANYIPQRGDIAIFKFPKDLSKDFIKRVIGLPGEEIEVRDKKVLINGRELHDPWGVHTDPSIVDRRDRFGPVVIPSGHYFVMGDNREHSYDSRYWGFVDALYIKGNALYIYWAKDKSRIGNTIQ
jgi:signal peptidase I